MLRVYVTTSDNYLPALRPFAHLLNKFWVPNPEVVVGGFTPPEFMLPPNFHFHSIGQFEDYPISKWSDALIKFVLEMPHEVFALMLEDYWITKPVDVQVVNVAYEYMKQFEYVARFDLTADRQFAGGVDDYGKVEDLDLVISDPGSAYHMSLMAGIWRREHLLRIMRPEETPWDLEIFGTPRLAALNDEVIVLGTKVRPVWHTLAFRGGDTGRLLLDEIDPEDVSELRRLGLLDGLE